MSGKDDAVRFATEFPEQFATVAGRALGALNGIERIAGSSPPHEEGSIDPEAAGRLHELYRRRIAPELESAAALASEANLALRRSLDLNGEAAGVPDPTGHASEVAGIEVPDPPESERTELPADDPPQAYRAWSLALEERRATADRPRLFRRRRRRGAA